MGLYKNNNGVLEPIAGRGKAEYGASTVRSGVIDNIQIDAGASGYLTISFDTEMPDNNYVVVLYPSETGQRKISCYANNRLPGRFNIIYSNLGDTALSNFTIQWYAFKLYTDNEYNNLLSAIPSTAGASNKLVDTNTLNEKAPDTEWINSSVSGFTYRKKNGIVFLHMYYNVSTDQTSDYQVDNVLPEGFRPSKKVFGCADHNSTNALITAAVDTTGGFIFYKTPSTVTQIARGMYNGYFCFPVD